MYLNFFQLFPGNLESEKLLEKVNQLYYQRLFEERKSEKKPGSDAEEHTSDAKAKSKQGRMEKVFAFFIFFFLFSLKY